MPRAKFWIFTSYEDEPPLYDKDNHNYLTYQKEQCPTTGKSHWQGYVEHVRSCNLRTVQGGLGSTTIHCEPSRSSAAIDYCHKQETRIEGPFEYGRRPDKNRNKRGSRSDLHELGEFIKSGGTIRECSQKFTSSFIKYHSGLTKLWSLQQPKRSTETTPTIEIYWGQTGTGKSRKALEENEGGYWKPVGKWWDGYAGEHCVIFDDFDGDREIPVGQLLRITDRYPLRVEYKGGSIELQATKFIFTSNLHWKDWYQHERVSWIVHWAAFERRITECTKMGDIPEHKEYELVE